MKLKSRGLKLSKEKLFKSTLFTFIFLTHAGCAQFAEFFAEHLHDVENTLFLHTEVWLFKRTADISRADGRRLIDTMFNSGLSLSRIKTVKGFINHVYTWGMEEGLIADVKNSPVHGMELPKEAKKMKPILTTDEIKQLMY
ncbi:MAG: hypothetical protein H7177_06250 [Rhizobacter sp.]|nr:hypothetical protein [Bacteriovorax sp.]